MKTKNLLAALFLTITSVSPGFAVTPAESPANPGPQPLIQRASKPVPDEYIVILKPGVARGPRDHNNPKPSVPEVARNLAAAFDGNLLHVYEYALQGFSIRLPEERARNLARHPKVEMVEESSYFEGAATQVDPSWGLDRIDQRSRTLDSSFTYHTTSSNVHAFVLDSGLQLNHPEFTGRVSAGYTAIADGNVLSDCNGHGTHVTGILAGTTYGVAKGAIIHPVRVLGCSNTGTSSQIIAGVDWVTANSHLKPAVANMSLRGSANTSMDTAVRNSIAAGITYVLAAGNENSNACNYSPARVAEAITVGNSTSSDQRNANSNYGSCVDLFAPGTSIRSAYPTNSTAYLTGTSMSSPHVAGVAALYLADHPTASPATVTAAILDKSTKNVLTGIGVGSPNRLLYSRLDLDEPPVASFNLSCSGMSCTFYSTATDDIGIVTRSWDFGDGDTDSGSPVSHTYSFEGTYTVTHTVTDTADQIDETSREVTVPFDPCGGDPCCGDPCCGDACCGDLCCFKPWMCTGVPSDVRP